MATEPPQAYAMAPQYGAASQPFAASVGPGGMPGSTTATTQTRPSFFTRANMRTPLTVAAAVALVLALALSGFAVGRATAPSGGTSDGRQLVIPGGSSNRDFNQQGPDRGSSSGSNGGSNSGGT